jgi:hypothetical protein
MTIGGEGIRTLGTKYLVRGGIGRPSRAFPPIEPCVQLSPHTAPTIEAITVVMERMLRFKSALFQGSLLLKRAALSLDLIVGLDYEIEKGLVTTIYSF